MTSADSTKVDPRFLGNAMAAFIQIAAVVVLAYWCFTIVSPFIHVIVWGLVISVALYPTHTTLSARLGGREKLSATLITLAGIAIIAVPSWLLADSTIGGLKYIATELEDGNAQIPPPADSVAEWPIVGGRIHEVWSAAATNLEQTLNDFQPQLRSLGQRALGFAGHTAASVLLFIVSMIIAGVLFMSAGGGKATANNLAASLVGPKRGNEFVDLSILTVRSVAKGVIGVALIQTILSAILLLAAGVPFAGIWTGIVLVLAIAQLPPLIILGPIAVWYFSVAEVGPAVIFAVFAIIVSVSDAFLKPLLLGRGVETPMLVILIGAIGGAISAGIVGLFLGAVILALGYELLVAWMAPDEAHRQLAEQQS